MTLLKKKPNTRFDWFFFSKKWIWTQNVSTGLVWSMISFRPIHVGENFEFLAIFTFSAHRGLNCSHSRTVTPVHLVHAESFDPSHTIGADSKITSRAPNERRGRECDSTICNFCEVRWYVTVKTYYHRYELIQIFSTPQPLSLIWLGWESEQCLSTMMKILFTTWSHFECFSFFGQVFWWSRLKSIFKKEAPRSLILS